METVVVVLLTALFILAVVLYSQYRRNRAPTTPSLEGDGTDGVLGSVLIDGGTDASGTHGPHGHGLHHHSHHDSSHHGSGDSGSSHSHGGGFDGGHHGGGFDGGAHH